MRRLLLASAICLASFPAFAGDVTGAWVRQLRLDGYERITISRTWLGRTRILAVKGCVEREIMLNRRTGEVLRDYSRDAAGTLRLPLGFQVELDDEEDDHEDGSDDEEDEEDEEDDEEDDGEDDEGEDD